VAVFIAVLLFQLPADKRLMALTLLGHGDLGHAAIERVPCRVPCRHDSSGSEVSWAGIAGDGITLVQVRIALRMKWIVRWSSKRRRIVPRCAMPSPSPYTYTVAILWMALVIEASTASKLPAARPGSLRNRQRRRFSLGIAAPPGRMRTDCGENRRSSRGQAKVNDTPRLQRHVNATGRESRDPRHENLP
jgi:hypothetical protein